MTPHERASPDALGLRHRYMGLERDEWSHIEPVRLLGGAWMTPYYDEDGITIYHGDCREILPTLADIGHIVTDPPYGIGADVGQLERANTQRGRAAAPSRFYGESDWDRPLDDSTIDLLLSQGRSHIIWGGNYYQLPPTGAWLVWDKQTGDNRYADFEMAWSDLPGTARMFRFRWMGMLMQIPEHRVHPTQKPIPLMRWCLEKLTDDALVCDPFMGSGSTLRAAKDLGRRAIGIEIEERYCDIAVQRLAQGVLTFEDDVATTN